MFERILAMAKATTEPDSDIGSTHWSYEQFEKQLRAEVLILGRLLCELFVSSARDGLGKQQGKPPGRVRRRQFKGFFGPVTYWREGRYGHFSLDYLLGIAKGGFSHSVCLLACNLATRMSFAVSAKVFERFAGWSPDPVSIENMVMGIGPEASSYMEQSAPKKDPAKRQVLVIEIDGKAPPMATEQELKKRSASAKLKAAKAKAKATGKTSKNKTSTGKECRCCQRHRSKAIRRRVRKKKQAAKAKAGMQQKDPQDPKTKNGRSATLVVTYVLEEGPDGLLHGPKDKRMWADFGPRVNMMQWAKEEARRRGFDPRSRDIHLVMDGEKCLRDGMSERFPNATIALDIRHAEEHLHALSKLIHSSPEHREAFVENYRTMLYEGEARKMTEELQGVIDDANKQKKKDGLDPDDGEYEELEKEIAYFANRLDMMDYGKLKKKDLVIASGQVEGAARHLVGERMDCGGMRWKVERGRMILHLRCIELNGDWDKFDSWLSKKNHTHLAHGKVVRLTSTKPPPMPLSPTESSQAA